MADEQDVAGIVAGLSEDARADLTSNWDAACDADWQLVTTDTADFFERQVAAGFAELVPVDRDALEDPFAAERGIYPGGELYVLNSLGRTVRAHLESSNG